MVSLEESTSKVSIKSVDNQARLLIESKEGKRVSLGGVGVVYKLLAQETGGRFSVVEHPLEPRTLVPPHLHADEDEFSIVVEGKFGARIGDRIIEATPGCYILKPRGMPHTFWNPTDKQARLVEIISPAGFENFFEETSKLFPSSRLPDMGQVAGVASKYHLTLGWNEWIPELSGMYNLKRFGR